MEEFTKKCPSCDRIQHYSCKKTFLKAVEGKWECRKCAVSKSHAQRPRMFFDTEEYRTRMSAAIQKVRITDSYGEDFKRKCRLNRARQLIAEVNGKVNFNPGACKVIEDVGTRLGYSFQHALNGGEKMIEGFFVDGYDPKHNVVIEYDEPKHRTLSQSKRDRVKEKVIIGKVVPKEFWRYDETNNVLRDVISGKEIQWQSR